MRPKDTERLDPLVDSKVVTGRRADMRPKDVGILFTHVFTHGSFCRGLATILPKPSGSLERYECICQLDFNLGEDIPC